MWIEKMAKADIFVHEKRISVVGGDDGPNVDEGTERGDLEVTSSNGTDPNVTMSADRANIVLGGGQQGAAGIRLDGGSVDRNPDNYDPGGTKIGVYSDFEAGAPDIVSTTAQAFTYMGMEDRAGVHIGNSSIDEGETNGILVLSESGGPGAILGGGELRLGYFSPLDTSEDDDELPGRIRLWGDDATFEMGGPTGTKIELQADAANVAAGGDGQPGLVTIRDGNAKVAGFIQAKSKGLVLTDGDKNEAIVIEQGGRVTFPNTSELP